MNNPVLMDTLSSEQKRRNQKEIRQIQLLNAAGYQPQSFFHLLRGWFSRFSMRHADKTATDIESPGIHQPQHG